MTEQQLFEGVTEAEAAIRACESLSVSRSQLKYEVTERSEAGVTIKVTGTKPAEPRQETRSDSYGSSNGRSDSRGGDRGGRSGERSFGGDRSGRGSDRGRSGGRSGRSDGNRRPPRDEDEFSDRLAEEYKEFREMTAAPKEPVARRTSIDEGAQSEAAKRAAHVVRELVRLGGFDMEAQVSVDSAEGIEIDLHGSDEGLIIGRKGETLLALQFIVNRMVSKESEGSERVLVDCEGYRVRRQHALKTLAVKLGEKAKTENRTIAVTAMNAHDRRIFHVTLDGHEGLHTRSEGDGLYRKLLIVPEAAPVQREST